MHAFFSYYGGKWKLAERYGPPQQDHVVESFAGSAGYSCYWEPKKGHRWPCSAMQVPYTSN
jgi:site-specific DNA-adenine methylase